MSENSARAHHDLGGVELLFCLAVDRELHSLTGFDKQVDAVRQILGAKGVMSVDELRRGIEALPEEAYFHLSYYERWLRSIAAILLRRGVISAAELQDRLAAP